MHLEAQVYHIIHFLATNYRLFSNLYLHEDMRLKEQALAHTNEAGLVPCRYVAEDPLLTFLESL